MRLGWKSWCGLVGGLGAAWLEALGLLVILDLHFGRGNFLENSRLSEISVAHAIPPAPPFFLEVEVNSTSAHIARKRTRAIFLNPHHRFMMSLPGFMESELKS